MILLQLDSSILVFEKHISTRWKTIAILVLTLVKREYYALFDLLERTMPIQSSAISRPSLELLMQVLNKPGFNKFEHSSPTLATSCITLTPFDAITTTEFSAGIIKMY